LGYYSLIANKIGCNVISVDNCDYFLDLFRGSIKYNNLGDIKIVKKLVDDNFLLEDL